MVRFLRNVNKIQILCTFVRYHVKYLWYLPTVSLYYAIFLSHSSEENSTFFCMLPCHHHNSTARRSRRRNIQNKMSKILKVYIASIYDEAELMSMCFTDVRNTHRERIHHLYVVSMMSAGS